MEEFADGDALHGYLEVGRVTTSSTERCRERFRNGDVETSWAWTYFLHFHSDLAIEAKFALLAQDWQMLSFLQHLLDISAAWSICFPSNLEGEPGWHTFFWPTWFSYHLLGNVTVLRHTQDCQRPIISGLDCCVLPEATRIHPSLWQVSPKLHWPMAGSVCYLPHLQTDTQHGFRRSFWLRNLWMNHWSKWSALTAWVLWFRDLLGRYFGLEITFKMVKSQRFSASWVPQEHHRTSRCVISSVSLLDFSFQRNFRFSFQVQCGEWEPQRICQALGLVSTETSGGGAKKPMAGVWKIRNQPETVRLFRRRTS